MSEREEFEEYYKSEGWAPDDVDWKAWQAARRTVSRQEALEGAAKVCEAVSIDFARRLKASDNSTYLEGKADGAQACAIALLRLADAASVAPADAKKDVALTDELIKEIAEGHGIWPDAAFMVCVRAILAANKESGK